MNEVSREQFTFGLPAHQLTHEMVQKDGLLETTCCLEETKVNTMLDTNETLHM